MYTKTPSKSRLIGPSSCLFLTTTPFTPISFPIISNNLVLLQCLILELSINSIASSLSDFGSLDVIQCTVEANLVRTVASSIASLLAPTTATSLFL